MYRRGLVVACEGNLSVRIEPERILVTPTAVCKGHLAPQDLLVTDLNGIVKRGAGRPSSEILLHLLFYRLRPDVHAICHAHPQPQRHLRSQAARSMKRSSQKSS